MSKTIDFSKNVYELCKESPEIIEIMRNLGFDSITSPGMLKTAGRFMTIPKGAAMKGIDLKDVKALFISKGFNVNE